MAGLTGSWSDAERLTLRLAPVWVLSALTGRCRFDEDERGAFWDGVTEAAVRSTGAGRAILSEMAAERTWLFDEFELDGRPVVSGLLSVTQLLERMSPEDRHDVRLAVLRVGQHVGVVRGPFGRRISTQDEQTLLLVQQLLRTTAEVSGNNPLNSSAAI